MLYIATGRNSIGRFYETFEERRRLNARERIRCQTRRSAFGTGQTPFLRVNWSMRNNVNMQQSGILFAMNFVARERAVPE